MPIDAPSKSFPTGGTCELVIAKDIYVKYFSKLELFNDHAPRFVPDRDGFACTFGDAAAKVTFRCSTTITSSTLEPLASSMRRLPNLGRAALQKHGEVLILHSTMPCTIRVAGTRHDAELLDIARSFSFTLDMLVR